MTFDEWFKLNHFDERVRGAMRQGWNAALDNAATAIAPSWKGDQTVAGREAINNATRLKELR